MTTFERVYAAVRLIPRGSVATYGQIARAIGNPRLSRVVGYALHVNPEPVTSDCNHLPTDDKHWSLIPLHPCHSTTVPSIHSEYLSA